MSIKTQTPDFIAELRYLSPQEGGRKTPANSGYRPHVKFPFSEKMTSGIQKFIDKEFVNPGETVQAKITILSPQFFENMLEVGMEFEVGEGSSVVAFGKLIEILNLNLKKESGST